jgi:H+/gluconate symporter-like permease
MTTLGLLGSVVLLIVLALRGINIIFASLLCSTVVILTNNLPIATGLAQYFSFGPLGAFTFAGKFFLLFAAGAIFGRVMGESHAAASIALRLIDKLGADRALWITVLACALLTYGGVVVFVVIFAMYPLGLKLLQEADIPKRLFCAALALGAGTFTLTALPGTPSIQNVIASVGLGTDLFAGFWLGIGGGVLMLVFGMWYLETERKKARLAGEHFELGPNDKIFEVEQDQYPHWMLAMVPITIVLSLIIAPRLMDSLATGDSGLAQLVLFASSQPVVWPSIALIFGSVVACLMFKSIRASALNVMGQGTNDAIMPLINTAAVIGFGGVVTQTVGFEVFSAALLGSDLPPLISAFTSVSLVSAITGSASGGLQIFMQTLAPAYLEMGIEPQVLHRIVTIASGGFDSLPHCGAVVAMLTITGLTHKQAYKDVGVITVVIPVVVCLILIGALAII